MAPSPGAMQVTGGAGITENLDRPNMPLTQSSFILDPHSQNLTTSGSSAGPGAVGGAVKSAFEERRRSGGANQLPQITFNVKVQTFQNLVYL